MTDMAERFLHELKIDFPDQNFEIMACRQNILEDNAKDTLVLGWLASSPMRKRGHNACVIQLLSGSTCIDVSDVILDASCAVYITSPAVHVGILAVAETGTVKEFYVFIDPQLCHEYWLQHQSIPNAHVLTSFILNHIPEVRTASLCHPLEPALRNLEETVSWMQERESCGAVFTGTTSSIVVPIGSTGLFLDLLTSGVNTQTAVSLTYPYPHNLKRIFGGILSGAPGAGKFTAMTRVILNEGGRVDMGEEEGLASGATLILLPSQGFAHRSAQLRSNLLGFNVVCVPSFHVLETLTYASVMAADVLAVAADLFSSKAYQTHACKFTSNIAWNPDWVLPMYFGLTGNFEGEVYADGSRKSKRQRILPTLNRPSTPGQARTFFDQNGRGDAVDGCSGAEARDLPLDMFCNMTELVSKYLCTLPTGWENILITPVLELFKFHRIVFCELQNASASFEGHLESFRANRRWLVDSSAFKFRFWSDTSVYWEMVLDATVRDLENRCDKYAFCVSIATSMASVPAAYHQENDALPLVLYDALFSSSDNPIAGLIAKQLPHIFCVSSEQCASVILFLREMAFNNINAPGNILETLTGVLDYMPPVPLGAPVLKPLTPLAIQETSHAVEESKAGEEDANGSEDSETESDSDSHDDTDDDDSEDDVDVANALDEDEVVEVEEVNSDDDSSDDSSDDESGPPNTAEGALTSVLTPTIVMKHVKEMQALGRRVQQDLANMQNAPCSICQEGCLEAILPCGHSFCASCICAWIALENVCPTCMAPGGPLRTPILVPILSVTQPLPGWCPDDATLRKVWEEDVCAYHSRRIPVFAFWMLVHLVLNERAGYRVLIVCKSKARCKTVLAVLDVLAERYGSWKGSTTDVDATATHCVSKLKRVVHGPRISNVNTVLMTCPVEPEEGQDIFLRLRNLGNAVVMRSCAFDIGNH